MYIEKQRRQELCVIRRRKYLSPKRTQFCAYWYSSVDPSTLSD